MPTANLNITVRHMKKILISSLIVVTLLSQPIFAQIPVSSAGMKFYKPSGVNMNSDSRDKFLNIDIQHNIFKKCTFWKLTNNGFMFYVDGRFYYEEGFFRNVCFPANLSGSIYAFGVLNGFTDFRLTPYYHNPYYNLYSFFSSYYCGPYTYHRMTNTNSSIPVFTEFRIPNRVPHNPGKPVINNYVQLPAVLKLSLNVVKETDEPASRKLNSYHYEKTKYDDIYNNVNIYDTRKNYINNKNNSLNFTGNSKNTGSNPGSSNSNRNYSGSKTVTPVIKSISQPVKKSD
jgi:hypothetical protein